VPGAQASPRKAFVLPTQPQRQAPLCVAFTRCKPRAAFARPAEQHCHTEARGLTAAHPFKTFLPLPFSSRNSNLQTSLPSLSLFPSPFLSLSLLLSHVLIRTQTVVVQCSRLSSFPNFLPPAPSASPSWLTSRYICSLFLQLSFRFFFPPPSAFPVASHHF